MNRYLMVLLIFLSMISVSCFKQTMKIKEQSQDTQSNQPNSGSYSNDSNPSGSFQMDSDSNTNSNSNTNTNSGDSEGQNQGSSAETITYNQDCNLPGVGDHTNQDYYKININKNGGTDWSSLSYSNNSIFTADQRFRVRIKVNSVPSAPGCDLKHPYQKLKFWLKVRKSSNSTYHFAAEDIEPISIGSCTNVIDVPINNNVSGQQIIEITDVRSDYVCNFYTPVYGQGHPTIQQYCGPTLWPVASKSCWSVELQVVTDYTKDFAN